MAFRFRDNIKVHWAGAEVLNQFVFLPALGIQYYLYSAFPFIDHRLFGKGKAPIMPLQSMKILSGKALEREMINYIAKRGIHSIQDSGLFTLLFGSRKGSCDEKMMARYYDEFVAFTNEITPPNVTCVECDCQNMFGVEKGWEYRMRLRGDIRHRIINVFHPIDGQKGLDRLIEFSDYLAISVPELKAIGKGEHVYRLASYIKNKKPSIDIHLLGCTDVKLLKACRFCTSSDSTSWVASKRFGFLDRKHISRIKTEKVKSLVSKEDYQLLRSANNEVNTNAVLATVYKLKHQYEKSAGNQDYTK